MNAWTVGLVVGGVVLVAVAGLCAFVLRALQTTAETTEQLARALEQVQARTAALAQLDAATSKVQAVTRDLAQRPLEVPHEARREAPPRVPRDRPARARRTR
ncbi:MAG: hypothetical protein ACRD1K_16110 [Acidimicrobiales bacterium]